MFDDEFILPKFVQTCIRTHSIIYFSPFSSKNKSVIEPGGKKINYRSLNYQKHSCGRENRDSYAKYANCSPQLVKVMTRQSFLNQPLRLWVAILDEH